MRIDLRNREGWAVFGKDSKSYWDSISTYIGFAIKGNGFGIGSTFITFAAKSTEYGAKKTVQIVCKKGEEGVRMVPGQYLCSDGIEIAVDAGPSFFIPHPFLPDQPGIFFQSVVY